MNYKVLYRKYRPDDFDNIVGQDYIIQTSRNSINYNNISHAYIFSGPRGTGKTSTAKVFAKAINCLNCVDGSPCNNCEFCRNFQENPDIIEIDAASNNGVNEIRNLIDNVKLTPSNGKYKIYIIDEVHMLTTSAFNALLLTLEEPPKHVVFILATTNIENVPITILSRCQRFDFQKISIDDITKRLKYICEIENILIDDEALKEIAYLSEGGMRDALSILDQLSKNKEKITLELVENKIKIVSKKNIDDLINSIDNNDLDSFLNIIDIFRKNGTNYKYIVKRLIDELSLYIKNIKIGRIKSRITIEQYKKVIMDLVDSLNKININIDSFTILEINFMNLFNNNNEVDKKTENIDFEKEINRRINNCFVGAEKQFLEEYKKIFDEICELKEFPQNLKLILLDSDVVAASKDYIIISCENDFIAKKNNELLDELEENIKKYSNKNFNLIFISDNCWQKVKKEYIINIRNGYKYTFINDDKSNEELN